MRSDEIRELIRIVEESEIEEIEISHWGKKIRISKRVPAPRKRKASGKTDIFYRIGARQIKRRIEALDLNFAASGFKFRFCLFHLAVSRFKLTPQLPIRSDPIGKDVVLPGGVAFFHFFVLQECMSGCVIRKSFLVHGRQSFAQLIFLF